MAHLPENGTVVYLALGSNLGERAANLRAAVARLGKRIMVEQTSSLYETAPAYVIEQPHFLNAALRGRTQLAPAELLSFLKSIERELGRQAGVRFGPRVIDLDILLYGELALDTPALTIPHPRMAERPFVLVPLAEIAPTLTPPGWSRTVGELARQVRGQGDILLRKGAFDDASTS
jgi:2-amino-4-hydroxy-6-hydroxymethyldihydropteridine diphosphokinase